MYISTTLISRFWLYLFSHINTNILVSIDYIHVYLYIQVYIFLLLASWNRQAYSYSDKSCPIYLYLTVSMIPFMFKYKNDEIINNHTIWYYNVFKGNLNWALMMPRDYRLLHISTTLFGIEIFCENFNYNQYSMIFFFLKFPNIIHKSISFKISYYQRKFSLFLHYYFKIVNFNKNIFPTLKFFPSQS